MQSAHKDYQRTSTQKGRKKVLFDTDQMCNHGGVTMRTKGTMNGAFATTALEAADKNSMSAADDELFDALALNAYKQSGNGTLFALSENGEVDNPPAEVVVVATQADDEEDISMSCDASVDTIVNHAGPEPNTAHTR